MKPHFRLNCIDFILVVAIIILHFWPRFCPRRWFFTEWHKSFFEPNPELHLVGKWNAYKLVFRPSLYERVEGMGMTVNSDGTCSLENCYYSEFDPVRETSNPKFAITSGKWSVSVDTNRWEKRFLLEYSNSVSKSGLYDAFWGYDMDGDYFISWSGFGSPDGREGIFLFKENTNVPVLEKKHKPY